MNSTFLRRANAIAVIIIVVGGALFKLFGHHEPPPMQPAITTEQAYDQICGDPDACAKMRDFMQYVAAEKKQFAAAEAEAGATTGPPLPKLP